MIKHYWKLRSEEIEELSDEEFVELAGMALWLHRSYAEIIKAGVAEGLTLVFSK